MVSTRIKLNRNKIPTKEAKKSPNQLEKRVGRKKLLPTLYTD